jgi:PAS domain S-box-containing protein
MGRGKERARILIVDDARTELAYFEQVLEEQGYEAFIAADGPSCLAVLPEARPDLILLDIMMPGMDGYEVCSRIKTQAEWKDVPIIFLSSIDEGISKSRAFSMGAADYVIKQIDTTELLARIRTQLLAAEAHRKEAQLAGELEKGIGKRTAELRTLIDTIPDLVWMKDPDGAILECNRRYERLVGAPREAILGKHDYDFFGREEAEFYRDRDRLAVAEGRTIMNEEEVAFADDGHHELLEVLKTPVYGEDGKVFAVLGIGRDITSRKLAEEKLRQSLREKDTLIRELYHRVNNTLQIVSGLVSLQASEHSGPVDPLELANTIETRIGAISLVHEMLYQSQDLSRISMKEYVPNLVSLIFQIFDMPSDRIVPVVEAEDLFFLLDTAIPLGLILVELVTNSLKYAFSGGASGRIAISLGRDASGRNHLHYEDNGIGLPEGFDFRRQKSLGFSLVHNLGEGQLGGAITMQGRGGFTFDLSFAADLNATRG